MSDYYGEFMEYYWKAFGFPGPIVRFSEYRPHLDVATRVWIERENGEIKWAKVVVPIPKIPKEKTSRIVSLNMDLTKEELEEFFWIKLRAHNV